MSAAVHSQEKTMHCHDVCAILVSISLLPSPLTAADFAYDYFDGIHCTDTDKRTMNLYGLYPDGEDLHIEYGLPKKVHRSHIELQYLPIDQLTHVYDFQRACSQEKYEPLEEVKAPIERLQEVTKSVLIAVIKELLLQTSDNRIVTVVQAGNASGLQLYHCVYNVAWAWRRSTSVPTAQIIIVLLSALASRVRAS